jgi:transposase
MRIQEDKEEWEFPYGQVPRTGSSQEGIPMDGILVCLGRSANRRFRRKVRECEDAKLKTRYFIVLSLDVGRSAAETARVLEVSIRTVYRVRQRFLQYGEAGLIDRREENGVRKADEDYLEVLHDVVASYSWEHGWPRPTWTQEMLVETLKGITGVTIAVGTMSRALKKLRARHGRPKPAVGCPWSKPAKERRLWAIRRLLRNLRADEVAFYEDEVDIHLNPKIGSDWMVRGQQKQVPTPGQNEKRYLAGAQDVRTGELIWVEGERKSSPLFILLLWELVQRHREAKVVHVILDNYSIHHTDQVKTTLQTPEGQRIKLHFLPPYCPDDNKIERTWQDLHANVTRNHRCLTMQELMRSVRRYLRQRNRNIQQEQRLAA